MLRCRTYNFLSGLFLKTLGVCGIFNFGEDLHIVDNDCFISVNEGRGKTLAF